MEALAEDTAHPGPTGTALRAHTVAAAIARRVDPALRAPQGAGEATPAAAVRAIAVAVAADTQAVAVATAGAGANTNS